MVKLYVEGGGNASLNTSCREGFTAFISGAGIKKRPRIVACGSRSSAYDRFCIAIKQGEKAMLLVDSEGIINPKYQQGQQDTWQPWAHLKNSDNWDPPQHCTDTDCHLMVQVMESWFLADREALKAFFEKGFNANALPTGNKPIENESKVDVLNALKQATHGCKKKTYNKGKHSFGLLAKISPNKITQASPWAKRFVDELCKKMDA